MFIKSGLLRFRLEQSSLVRDLNQNTLHLLCFTLLLIMLFPPQNSCSNIFAITLSWSSLFHNLNQAAISVSGGDCNVTLYCWIAVFGSFRKDQPTLVTLVYWYLNCHSMQRLIHLKWFVIFYILWKVSASEFISN